MNQQQTSKQYEDENVLRNADYKLESIILDLDRTMTHRQRFSAKQWDINVMNNQKENKIESWHQNSHLQSRQTAIWPGHRTIICYRPYMWHLLQILNYFKRNFGTKIIICTKASETYANIAVDAFGRFTTMTPGLIDAVYSYNALTNGKNQKPKCMKPFRQICIDHNLNPSKTLIVDDDITAWKDKDIKTTNVFEISPYDVTTSADIGLVPLYHYLYSMIDTQSSTINNNANSHNNYHIYRTEESECESHISNGDPTQHRDNKNNNILDQFEENESHISNGEPTQHRYNKNNNTLDQFGPEQMTPESHNYLLQQITEKYKNIELKDGNLEMIIKRKTHKNRVELDTEIQNIETQIKDNYDLKYGEQSMDFEEASDDDTFYYEEQSPQTKFRCCFGRIMREIDTDTLDDVDYIRYIQMKETLCYIPRSDKVRIIIKFETELDIKKNYDTDDTNEASEETIEVSLKNGKNCISIAVYIIFGIMCLYGLYLYQHNCGSEVNQYFPTQSANNKHIMLNNGNSIHEDRYCNYTSNEIQRLEYNDSDCTIISINNKTIIFLMTDYIHFGRLFYDNGPIQHYFMRYASNMNIDDISTPQTLWRQCQYTTNPNWRRCHSDWYMDRYQKYINNESLSYTQRNHLVYNVIHYSIINIGNNHTHLLMMKEYIYCGILSDARGPPKKLCFCIASNMTIDDISTPQTSWRKLRYTTWGHYYRNRFRDRYRKHLQYYNNYRGNRKGLGGIVKVEEYVGYGGYRGYRGKLFICDNDI